MVLDVGFFQGLAVHNNRAVLTFNCVTAHSQHSLDEECPILAKDQCVTGFGLESRYSLRSTITRSPLNTVCSIPVDGTSNGRNPAASNNQLLCAKEAVNASGINKTSHQREHCAVCWLGARRAYHAAAAHRPISVKSKTCTRIKTLCPITPGPHPRHLQQLRVSRQATTGGSSLRAENFINLPHNRLRPLNTRGNQLVRSRTPLRSSKQIVRAVLMCRLARIAAMIPITRFRPSSIGRG